MPLKSISSLAKFTKEFIFNPGPTGSLFPSGRALGRRMAFLVPTIPSGLVVELGAGTGSITAALLQRGIASEKLVLVESSPAMVKELRKRYPQLLVIPGSAARLQDLLKEHLDPAAAPISHIVSGLPLRSLPKSEVAQIVRETRKVLHQGGHFIQFTYDLRDASDPALREFILENSSVVWMNFPPARVKVYQVERVVEQMRAHAVLKEELVLAGSEAG